VGSAFQLDTEYALHVILLERALDHVAQSVLVKVVVESVFEELAFATFENPTLRFGVPDKSLAILGSLGNFPEVPSRKALVGNDDRHSNDPPNESAYLVDNRKNLEDTIDWTLILDRNKDPFANFLIQKV